MDVVNPPLIGNRMKKLLLGSLICLSLAGSFCANAASVFKVSKGGDTIYIGGTFHLLTEKDYPLPEAYEKAYKASNEVYFETDIGAMSLPEFQQKSMGVILYQDGNTLKTGLKPDTFARLTEYATSRGLDINQFLPLNPTGIMLTITIMEYQARGFVAQGVDEFYFEKSKTDNKTINWFETPDEQLAILDTFDSDDPDGLINYTLDEIGNFDEMVGGLHKSWRDGDMKTLTEIGISGFKDYPEIYDSILKVRNDKWMPVLEGMFGDEGNELILVGALHLSGPDGVLTQLEAKGYKVEKL